MPVMNRGARMNASPPTPRPIQITDGVTAASTGCRDDQFIYDYW